MWPATKSDIAIRALVMNGSSTFSPEKKSWNCGMTLTIRMAIKATITTPSIRG